MPELKPRPVVIISPSHILSHVTFPCMWLFSQLGKFCSKMSCRNQNLYGEECHKINEGAELLATSSDRKSRKSRRRAVCLCTLCFAITVLVVVAVLTLSVLFVARSDEDRYRLPDEPYDRALALLTDFPVIDG